MSNLGPEPAGNVVMTFFTSAGATFTSLVAPDGWACTTPKKGKSGPVTCSRSSFESGSAAVFSVVVTVTAKPGTVVFGQATVVSDTDDPNSDDNSAISTTSINR